MTPFFEQFDCRQSHITTQALFDRDEPDNYRYSLVKQWGDEGSECFRAATIMFNPSKARESVLDLTVMNLLNKLTTDPCYYATEILNMYPLMTPDWKNVDFDEIVPSNKRKLNLDYIEYTLGLDHTNNIIVAWGAEPGGVYYDSDNTRKLVEIIKQAKKPIYCFGYSKDTKHSKRWQPRHPRMGHLLEPLTEFPFL